MALSTGARLGSYEIIAPLGAGGMGEVYRARDTKLNRDVAIKILPEAFASDADRVARFTREAQTLAALNHPHIAQIYGLEQSSTTAALVMELVEGEDLAQRIAHGPIPLDEALALARQVAEALEAAHEQGIIHRDLKPANIKIRPDGTVKVLDFGLAKAGGTGRAGADDLANSPTLTVAATYAGMILGTAAYMAPEQARGKPVDKRADIWAFGCVLYEMLAGTPAFGGDTATDIIAAVVHRDPDWTKLPADTPTAVKRLLQRCLRKDPKLRLRDLGDARLELQEADSAPVVPPASPARSALRRRERIAWAAIVALLALSVIALLVRGRMSASLQPLRAALAAPESADMAFARGVALSPDGEWLVFSASQLDGRTLLWLRRLDEVDSRPLASTDGATYPFWSPDGASIAFFADRKLKRIARSGGVSQTLCEAPVGRGGTWSASGGIVFAPGYGGAGSLYRVAAAGGDCTPVTTLDTARGESFHVAPHFLPDGRHFLFVARGQGPLALRVGSLDSTDPPATLITGATRAQYASGYLLFDREKILLAQRFDPEARRLSGEPIAMSSVADPAGLATFSASTGRLVLKTAHSQSSQLTWVDRRDNLLGVLAGGLNFWTFRLARDGTRLAGNNDTASGGLSLAEVDRGTTVGLTTGTVTSAPDLNPVWSPDGTRVIFQRFSGRNGIYQKIVGHDEEAPFITVGDPSWPTDWSKDGRFVLFTRRAAGSTDIWAHAVDDQKTFAVVTTPGNDDGASFSPDGRWIAYASDETGAAEVQMRPFPGPGPARRVSPAGGVAPKWRADGRELFYIAPGGALMAVTIQFEAEPRLGTPTLLFRRPLADGVSTAYAPYDLAATSTDVRFLLNVRVGRPNPLDIIVGWPRLLEQQTR